MKRIMKRIAALLMASVVCFQGSGIVYAADDVEVMSESPYRDVNESDWYFDGVCYMKNAAIMTGVGTGEYFMPGECIQRQDVALILGRHYKNTIDSNLNLNQSNGAYYTDALNWVKKYKIMNGYNPDNFCVGDAITRQDFAVTLYNYLHTTHTLYEPAEVLDPVLNKYPDADEVSSYAWKAMDYMVRCGIIQGTGTDVKMLDPNGIVTRGMAAVMLQRYIEMCERNNYTNGHKGMLL